MPLCLHGSCMAWDMRLTDGSPAPAAAPHLYLVGLVLVKLLVIGRFTA